VAVRLTSGAKVTDMVGILFAKVATERRAEAGDLYAATPTACGWPTNLPRTVH
jgi:hypothetical protein